MINKNYLFGLSIVILAFLLYYSTPIIDIHERAHDFGAYLTGRSAAIRDNVTSIDKLYYKGDFGILIYSGMPYIIMMLLTLVLFLTKSYWKKSELRWFIYIILTLFFFQFLINLWGFNVQGNDFKNILFGGTIFESIGILIVVFNFLMMFIMCIMPKPQKL